MDMEYKQLGKTGEKVFVIGLGTYGHGEAYGGISKEDSFEVLNSIVKSTPNYANLLVDTAPRYGDGMCEKWIGEFFNEFNGNNVLIATKGGRHIDRDRRNEKNFSSEFLKADLDKSLKRLRANDIFLYQLHNPPLEILTEGSVFDLLEEFRNAGKIRFYGVSIDCSEEGIAAIDICNQKEYDGLASIQVVYNILNKAISEKLFRIAQDSNISIIAREPLFRGFLTDTYGDCDSFPNPPPARKKLIDLYGWEQIQSKVTHVGQILKRHEINEPLSSVAIKFAISHPHVTVTIPGINRLEYVEPNLSAANIALDDEILLELNGIEDILPLMSQQYSTDLTALVETTEDIR